MFALVATKVGCLRRKREAGPDVLHDVGYAQEDVLLNGEEGVLVRAAKVGEDLQVERIRPELDEPDASRIGGDPGVGRAASCAVPLEHSKAVPGWFHSEAAGRP